MIKISVVIPFYQRETGILLRALNSIIAQKLGNNVEVHVVVVDDGSPISAADEIKDIVFKPPFYLNVITQKNGGVSRARNTGLKSLDNTTDYIAFLDSDDIWSENHLATAVNALENGYDFYFTDHMRSGHHASYFEKCCPNILPFINAQRSISPIAQADFINLTLRDFPSQASTVVYRRDCAADLFFDEKLKAAGEDIVFFTQLGLNAKTLCFNPDIMVECADGMNMFFGHFGWDDPARLSIVRDQIKTFTKILHLETMPESEKLYLGQTISHYKADMVFFCLRARLKNKTWPPELNDFKNTDGFSWLWFIKTALYVLIGKQLGLYKPAF